MQLSMRLLFFLVPVLFVGCENTPKPTQPAQATLQEHIAQQQTNLNRAIGKLTYDEAIQRWGQPAKVVQGDKITSVLWRQIADRGGMQAFPLPGSWAPVYVDMPSHGDQLIAPFQRKQDCCSPFVIPRGN